MLFRSVGSFDDVRDPFERVLQSGSPYAVAVDEDRIVDAKWEMEVSESTVSAWEKLFAELTGTQLGRGEGIGLPAFTHRHHVGMAREAHQRPRRTAPRPQVRDRAARHHLDLETERAQLLGDQVEAACVLGGDGAA